MTRRSVWFVAATLTAALSIPGSAPAHGRPCTVGALRGTYLFTASGFTTPTGGSSPTAPKAIVEVIRFHGDGTVDVPRATRNVNGMLFQENPGSSGTYTVDSDAVDGVCTGTLAFSAGMPNFTLYFDLLQPGVIDEIQNDTGNVFRGTAIRVGP